MASLMIFCPKKTDDSKSFSTTDLSSRLEGKVEHVDGSQAHVGMLDLALHVCRSRGAHFRRKLLLAPADLDFVLRILLQQANKQLTGDSSHTRSELIELEHTVRKLRGKHMWPTKDDNSSSSPTVVEAAGNYQKFLNDCNLVDSWSVFQSLGHLLRKDSENGEKMQVIVTKPLENEEFAHVAALGELVAAKSMEVVPGETRFTDISLSDVAIVEKANKENDSIKENDQKKKEDDPEEQKDDAEKQEDDNEDVEELSSPEPLNLDCNGLQIWVGLLRLLANSRDEVSLGRVLTLTGLVSGAQCQAVRQESRKVNLPMYQTILSYITQTNLGGKSYAPDEQHPFTTFGSNLGELVRLMEKLQTALEETPNSVDAVKKVTSIVTAWLVKRGVKFTSDLCQIASTALEEVKRRQEGVTATPGRAVVGRPAVRIIIGLVDRFASWPVRLESAAMRAAKTPARHKHMLAFFRTPQLDAESSLDIQDELDLVAAKGTVGERLMGAGGGGDGTPAGRPAAAYPRYKSSHAWAAESSSPLCKYDSAALSCSIAPSCTLVAPAASPPLLPSSGTSSLQEKALRILQEVKEEQEKERCREIEEQLHTEAKVRTKPAKRCLAKEVDEAVRDKLGLPAKKKKTEASENTKPRGGGGKKCPTPKGQRKLTAFFKAC